MINDPAAFMAGFWDWNILRGCFGQTKIRPTDIDGCVERNGQTLVIETKAPGAAIPKGQFIMYETWAKTGFFTVIVVWGHTDKPEACMAFRPDGTIMPRKAIDLDGFRTLVSAWYSWADSRKKVTDVAK